MKNIKYVLMLLSTTLIWGASFSLMSNISGKIPPAAYLSIRFSLASLALICVFGRRIRTFARDKSALYKTVKSGMQIGGVLFLGIYFQVLGLGHTTPANSAFITSLYFVFVPLISVLFLKTKLKGYAVIAVITAFAGVTLLSWDFGAESFSLNYGDAMTLLCAVFFAFQIILVDIHAQKNDPLMLGLFQIFTAAVLFLLTWMFTGVGTDGALSGTAVWVVICVTGLGGTAYAFTMQTICQEKIPASQASLLFCAEPVFALLFSLIIPGSTGRAAVPAVEELCGCCLILSGIALYQILSRKRY